MCPGAVWMWMWMWMGGAAYLAARGLSGDPIFAPAPFFSFQIFLRGSSDLFVSALFLFFPAAYFVFSLFRKHSPIAPRHCAPSTLVLVVCCVFVLRTPSIPPVFLALFITTRIPFPSFPCPQSRHQFPQPTFSFLSLFHRGGFSFPLHCLDRLALHFQHSAS